MATLTAFGQKIDKALKERNWKDSDLARKLNIASPGISTLKHKTKKPRKETIRKLSELFNLPEEYFLTIHNVPASAKTILRKKVREYKEIDSNPDGVLPGQLALEQVPVPEASPKIEDSEELNLKAYVVLELNGKVISKKQIKKLPESYEF